MKIDMRRLALTAVLLSTSTALPAVVHAQSFVGDSFADYYSDGEFADDAVDNEGRGAVAPTAYVGGDAGALVPPADTQQEMPPQWSAPMQAAQPMSTYASSGAGCYDNGCNPCGSIGRAICSDSPQVWMRAEMLLWFPQARDLPPLGAANGPGQTATALDNTLLFHESFGNNLTPGFRGDIGRYFADGMFGLGGRFWIIGDDNDSVQFAGDGTDATLVVPFFNTRDNIGEDGVFVAFDDGANLVTGNAVVESSMQILAAEIYGRARVGHGRNHRLEMIGGYSHFNIEDNLLMRLDRTVVPPGTETTFTDSFRTRNEFHGGQIGQEISLRRGRWTANSLTKVHFGTMSQRVAVAGSTVSGDIGNPPNVFDEGLFARGNVQGDRSRDVWAFAPEMNLRLGYQFRPNVNLSVGYTFIYWSNVALAGDQVDRNLWINEADIGNPGPERFVGINSRGLWAQGIDLGATIEF